MTPSRPASAKVSGCRACGHPHLGFALHWRRISVHFDRLTVTANHLDRLAAPERLDSFDAAGHQFTAVLVVVRLQREVAGVPSGREAQPHATVGQIVHDRPFLRDADRIVQREHHAPGPDADAPGNGGDSSAGQRRVRVEAAERMEMPLRRPHRGEPVLVGILRAFEQQAVLAAGRRRRIGGKVE